MTQLKAARQQLRQAQEPLDKCQVKGASEAQIESAQVAVAAGEASVEHWQAVCDTYRGHLEAISLQVHPWRLEDSTPQSAQEVEARLVAEVTVLQALVETHGLPLKEKIWTQVRKQLADLAAVGRNGYLSQMHHHHRGLPKRRYRVWSALYNFDCQASDGSTPASRFFRREFPSLFGYMSQDEEFPVGFTARSGLTVTVQLPVQEVVTFWSAFGHFLSGNRLR